MALVIGKNNNPTTIENKRVALVIEKTKNKQELNNNKELEGGIGYRKKTKKPTTIEKVDDSTVPIPALPIPVLMFNYCL